MFSRDLLIENEFLKIENGYLKRDIAEFHKLLNKLALKNEEQVFQIKSLKDRAKQDSSNSSLPPSKELYKTLGKKKKSDKKRGGQVGHKGSFRPFVDESQVTKIVRCMPQSICECGGEIKLRNRKKPSRHQVFELPEIKKVITEYQQFRGVCTCCKQRSQASLKRSGGKYFGSKSDGICGASRGII